MGAAGAVLISAGSVVSMTGNNVGQVLTGSRMLFALAENGELPRVVRHDPSALPHAGERDYLHNPVALGLALSGSFAMLAVVSAVARLVTYTGVCAATLQLRHQRFRDWSSRRRS